MAGLKNLWQGLIEAIACSSELQVWQTWSSSGIGWWHAYDPMTGQSVCTDSELELRLWIEQNYRGS
ncbi:MAG TPA: hypothetical protein DDZ80_24410 [Cyanobacteria bacterium UBA8803]|nr:hypothetical protein [Cyanobacteria bacterium UBA9273]HBL61454.1 hypothetical protein [Cyanobacteria bacterium UBA8803]